jgi:hypothetical protein
METLLVIGIVGGGVFIMGIVALIGSRKHSQRLHV